MELSIEKINEILKSNWNDRVETNGIKWVSIDSRSLHNNDETLFFAIKGDNHDAHDYINELVANGVQNFVVSSVPKSLIGQANFLEVEDTLKALQQLASFHRNQFKFPVIAITGSNGKTIVKEWLSYLLSPDYSVVKSPKSYNSQVGVPLSVFLMNSSHDLGLFEAGISTTSEMRRLETILRPNIGILTNIGSAHSEGFSSQKEKIKEKIQLFKSLNILVYKKNDLIKEVLEEEGVCKSVKSVLSWSFEDSSASVFIKTLNRGKTHSQIKALAFDSEFVLDVPFVDMASIENVITCFVTMLSLDIDFTTIQKRLSNLYPVQMRLQLKPAINNCTLIDDSYSNDFQSLTIALDFLQQQQQHKKKTLILSDMEQIGLREFDLYRKIFDLLKANKIDRVFVVGESISGYVSNIENAVAFESTSSLLIKLSELMFDNETILIKGARSFEFEKIVKALEYRKHETVLEVNLDALIYNLTYYKSKLKRGTKVMVMVKAFGYGNGGFELAKLLEHHRVDYLGVAFADEGIALKEEGIKIPVMVMNPEITSFRSIVQYGLEPEIYNFRGFKSFLKIAEELQLQDYPIHIKFDTGMHRLGFESQDVDLLCEDLLNSNGRVKVQSVLSHLAASDNSNFVNFTLNQIGQFEMITSQLISELGYAPILHVANTSGIVNYKNFHLDMVRLGIGLYGFGTTDEESVTLKNVSTLKTVISQIKSISQGDSVGYNRGYVSGNKMLIATLPIGYADGVSRLWGKEGYVVINEQRAKIIGAICMDMMMVDITNILCKEGDEVIVFGEKLSVQSIAKSLKTIPYEVLTQISQRVKRVYYRD